MKGVTEVRLYASFNSILVRLEIETASLPTFLIRFNVLIPYWFD